MLDAEDLLLVSLNPNNISYINNISFIDPATTESIALAHGCNLRT